MSAPCVDELILDIGLIPIFLIFMTQVSFSILLDKRVVNIVDYNASSLIFLEASSVLIGLEKIIAFVLQAYCQSLLFSGYLNTLSPSAPNPP